ncbi:MAG TPA: DUF1501 domain-containing protein [Pirellulales bacterium]|nr:DUF1501 domain-containing protein [Pirellulales bacterium]
MSDSQRQRRTRPHAGHPWSRRELLQVGYSSMLSVALAPLLARQARSAERATRAAGGSGAVVPRAKSVLLIFLTGGPSHIDTFDMKPDAPAEIRGSFDPISTDVPGIQFCEHLPLVARHASKLAIVRTMHVNPGLAAHETGTHAMLTGNNDLPPGSSLYASRHDWPCYAAGLDFVRPGTAELPSGVNLPTYMHFSGAGYCGQNAGMLGAGHDPWQLRHDPNHPKYKGDDSLTMPEGLSVSRFDSRRMLLAEIDRQRAALDAHSVVRQFNAQQQAACDTLTAGRLAKAFQLDDEPAALRDRYGRHMFGQSLLLARRVLQAGVPMVQANMGFAGQWDTHSNNCPGLKQNLLPPLDRAFAALLEDMQALGMLDETLVVLTGEFGRTPKLGGNVGTPTFSPDGRDHWTQCFTSVFAGCGVHGGRTIGTSDKTASFPLTKAFDPRDMGATVYSALGVDLETEIHDQLGRPLRLNTGQPIAPVFNGDEV